MNLKEEIKMFGEVCFDVGKCAASTGIMALHLAALCVLGVFVAWRTMFVKVSTRVNDLVTRIRV